jgi:3-hydroxyisobutyrate dehydrogenase
MAIAIVGFIGLGQMGVPMTRSLLQAGFPVLGFDLNPKAVAQFADAPGFTAAVSAAQVAQDCSSLILMLPDSRIVDALLWTAGTGLAAQMRPGQLLIDMGSSDPVHTRDNAAKLAALAIPFVDAPVSGGVKRAVSTTLSIMMGGDKAAVDQAMPLLAAMGKTLVHVGGSGSGHAVKALNNYVSAAGLLAVCEALVAAEKFGIDPHLANQVFNTSTGKNNTTDVKVENFMLSGAFNSGFAMALMRKDLTTAQGFIERMGTPGGFAAECLQTWQQAEAALAPGADHTAMFKFVKEQLQQS